MKTLAPYWKAVVGFVAPGAVLLIQATTEGSVGGSAITGGELLVAGLTCVVTASAVYGVPNKKAAEPPL